jgi:hypothetical protein
MSAAALARASRLSEPPKVTWVPFDTPAGEIMTPGGVAPGFGYNPGTAHLRVLAERLAASVERALANSLDDVAASMLRQLVDDVAFEQFMALPEGSFPVAILSKPQAELIGASSRMVLLPPRVVRKQVGESPSGAIGHPDLAIDDYRQISGIVDQPLLILQQGEHKLIYFADRRAPDRYWKVVIRQDEGETNPTIVSFQRANLREVAREARNKAGTVTILDERGLLQ